jgi:hypothetical protein
MFHQEADGVSAAPAAKAFVDFLAGRYGKGRGFLVVERAEAEVIRAPLFEPHKFSYHIDDVNTRKDFLYRLLGNQGRAMYADLIDEDFIYEGPSFLPFSTMPGRQRGDGLHDDFQVFPSARL